MAINFKQFWKGLRVRPKTASESDSQGDIEVLSTDGKVRYHNGTSNSPFVTESHSAILTNKTIDADQNTISNIDNADIKASAAIDRSKLASGVANRVAVNNSTGVLSDAAAITASRALVSDLNGIPTHSTVTTTELGYVGGVTSAIQTQLDAKASTTSLNAHTGASSGAHTASAITNVASGNLAATDVQGALNELQSDIDTRALSSDLSTHISDTTTHGTTGDIVGTSDAQVLTNKDIDGGTASNTSRLTVPKAAKATLDGLTRKEGTLVYASDENKLYADDGAALVELGAGGISTLNTLTAATQTFATGSSGTDFNISSATSTHTFNIPDASASNRGLVTTGAQTIAGDKTFTGALKTTSSLVLEDPGAGSNTTTIQAGTVSSSYSLTLPAAQGASNQALINNGSGTLSWATVATAPARSEVRLRVTNGYGSTDTKIPRYTTADVNTGTAITYSDSATEGTKFTINTTGYYSLSMSHDRNADEAIAGFSLNADATQRTTTLYSINTAARLAYHSIAQSGALNIANASWTGYLAAGDVVRPHSNGAGVYDANLGQCSIVFLGPAS